MAFTFAVDDNNKPFATPAGLGAVYTTDGIKAASTGAATAEIDISAFHTAGDNAHSQCIVDVVNYGATNAALVAFGAAGAAASYTGITNMFIVAPLERVTFKVTSAQVSLYHLQVTGATTIQAAVRV